MSFLQMTPLDTDYSEATSSVYRREDEVGSVASCYSQSCSTGGGYSGYCNTECQVVGDRLSSSVAQSDIVVQVDDGVEEVKVHLEGVERDCRICHLGLDNGVAIELGCSCKDDLAAAHKKCAETWFRIKGNMICEICNSVASNVVIPSNAEVIQQIHEMHAIARNSYSRPVSSNSENQSCFNGNRFLNYLLACMVFAFVISWIFHFNM